MFTKMDDKIPNPRTRRLNTKTNLCLPRFRATTSTTTAKKNHRRLSPMSLLDRFREAVFRLIMLSALSKAAQQEAGSLPGRDHTNRSSCYCYNPQDPYSSEAMADCIEFIKKTATTDDSRDSTASSSVDGGVFPVPVMY